ncbi:MAG: type II toxin-antitoxin system HicA family toxin [Nitrospirae bacterium]|nr:type II toxin-antitoxin system HicA family toxin [Nitrospirota bacterium]
MKSKELIRLLKEHGWVVDRIRGSHYIMIKDKNTVSVPYHGSKDLGKGLANNILKQAGIK